MFSQIRGLTFLTTALLAACGTSAADWPMWRSDAERSGASTEQLPAELQLQWTRQFEPRVQAWDDPLNLDLMTYDRIFEPIVMNGRMFISFNDHDKIAAFDVESGNELWSFYTGGPVRLPAVGWDKNVYFTSDDGYLYCVTAATGELQWKFRGAPGEQKAIGNQRVISLWPARGGAVIRDETVYFASSIWPMMGTFIYALDARTGEVKWVNDNTGSQFIKQPHSAPSFAGVAPQGALVATEDYLVVPGGRSVPAVLHRNNGIQKYFEINAGGKGTGGSLVIANDERFYVHTRQKGTRAFHLETGLKTEFMPNEPVLANGFVYTAELANEKPVVRAYGSDDKVIWEVHADGQGDLILAGNHLYAAGKNSITAIRLPKDQQPATVTETIPVHGQVERILAGNGKLFAVTLQGAIMAFGEGNKSAAPPKKKQVTALTVSPDATDTATKLLAGADTKGYALWYGISDESLIHALAATSSFTQLAIVDSDHSKVARLQHQLDAAGLYGKVTVHHSQPEAFLAPQYIANVLFVGHELATSANKTLLAEIYKSVRPYGGVMHLLAGDNRMKLAEAVRSMDFEQAEVSISDNSVIVRRVGKLPGSADWTHQHGNIANTVKSNDHRVKLPLGVLWFGGSSNMDVLPRHGHGPPEQVIGGRLFIEGMNSLSARDVYTGRVLWKREFKDLGTYDVYFDETYKDTPLNPQYNQVHIPGANGRGTNYIVTEDRVYMVEGNRCHVLDAANGNMIQDIEMPQPTSGEQREWGYVGVYGDLLLGGFGYANYRDRNDLTFESDGKLRRNRSGYGSKSLDRAASLGLVVFDRHSGDVLWQADARHSFWHNGVIAGDGKIFCLDRTPELIEAALRRRGKSRAASYRIVAFNAQTGDIEWEITDKVFGTWLGYSQKHDLLLQAGAAANDRLYAEVGQGMAVFHADDGTLKWEKDTLKYAGPCMLHNDWIITNTNSYTESAGAFHLTDGHQKMATNPLTGEEQPWKMTRAYGCNTVIASEHLLTFRSGAAGFYDLLGESGGGNFGGFKSGCTSNLVVANGVLNAPDYTRTCSCAYQNQTSLALIHMPDLDFWTINPAVADHTYGGQLQSVGINIGAPGDRRADNGLLWLEYPAVAGPSPLLSVTLNDDATLFQHHSSSVTSSVEPWVFASGADNVRQVSVRFTLQKEVNLQNGLPIGHADDDAEEQENGDVNLNSGDLELVQDKNTQLVGLRFNEVFLEQGTEIRSAFIQFVCDEPSSEPTSLIITAQDSGHAERFSSDPHNLSSRPRVDKELEWSPGKWKRNGSATEHERTVDLAPLVQAVVNRKDWKAGNSIAFFISGTGQRTAIAFQGHGESAPQLIVDADESHPADNEPPVASAYRVRLLFAPPQTPQSDLRQFSVSLQGVAMPENVTIDPADSVTKQFKEQIFENVMIADELTIELNPEQGTPVLSGIEIQMLEQL